MGESPGLGNLRGRARRSWGDQVATERRMWYESLRSGVTLSAIKVWAWRTAKEIKRLCYNLVCHSKAIFHISSICSGSKFCCKKNGSLFFLRFSGSNFFQVLRTQPRGESEGGSWDIPEPILGMGVLRVHRPQKESCMSQWTLCMQQGTVWLMANCPNNCVW